MRRLTLVLAGLTLVLGAAVGRAADWGSLPTLPEPRYGAAGATVDGAVHLVGGYDAGDLALHTVWSASAGAWIEARPLPASRFYPAAVSVGGDLLVIGGFDPSGWPLATVLRYDVAGGAWSPAASLPATRAACGAALLDGYVYVAGGESDYGLLPATVLRYGGGAWSAVANLPTPRSGPAVAAFGGRLYVIGGVGTGSPLATVEVYDPATGAWSPGPALPEPLWQAAAVAFDGRLWVAGGQDVDFVPTSHVYSLGSDGAWRAEAPLPVALSSAMGTADAERLVVAGGRNFDGPLAGAYEMLPAPVPPPPPPPATDTLLVAVTFQPATLNLGSHGKWISAWLDAEGWPIGDLDVTSLCLLGSPVDPDAPSALEDRDADGSPELMVKIPRTMSVGMSDGPLSVCVTGRTVAGAVVEGCGTLRLEGSSAAVNKRDPSRRRGLAVAAWGGRIVFSADAPVEATLDVLDVQGRVVERLFAGGVAAGQGSVWWPGAGRAVPAGVYFARFSTATDQVVARVAVLR